MLFIIPKNYKFKKRLLGVIDYSTAIFNVIWNIILYLILKNLSIKFSFKIFIFSLLSFPLLLLTVVGFNKESPFYVAKYLFKFLISQKIYLFNKNIKFH